MRTREQKSARRNGIRTHFEKWCNDSRKNINADSFIEFDAVNGKKFLDHKKAMDEGYYAHLRMQAAQLISSWATTVYRPTSGGALPNALVRARETKPLRIQEYYDVNGIKRPLKAILRDQSLLLSIIDDFKTYVENKTDRLRYFIEAHEKLSGSQRQASKTVQSVGAMAIQGLNDVAEMLQKVN